MKELRIKDICTKDSSSLKQKELKESGKYPVYGASGIAGYLDHYEQKEPYISIVKDGSGIGRVSFQEAKSSLIGTMQYILPKEGYSIRYIGYCLQSLNLSKYKQGAAIPHIYFRDYGESLVKVTDDPLDQQRIVGILDAEFEKIDALKANAEKNLQNAKDLFQAALKKELEPKEGWEEKTVARLCKIINGYAFPSSAFSEKGEVKSIKITNVGVGYFIHDDKNNVPKSYIETAKDVIVNESDIVVALTRTIISDGLKVAIVPSSYNHSLLNQRVAALRAFPNECCNRYIFYYFKTTRAQKYVLQKVNTLMQPNLSIADLRNMPIPSPSLDTQKLIVSRLDELSQKCTILQDNYTQTIALCDDLKQALLRKAFSGEL